MQHEDGTKRYLVTGAGGHLGNTLVRELAARGKTVRASHRALGDRNPFAGVDCEPVLADLLDRDQAQAVMENVDVCVHAAAVFRHWARDPENDIVRANLDMTRNVMEAAVEKHVQRVVYVSSIAAVDQGRGVFSDDTWNTRFVDHYYKSKALSERLAWELAEEAVLDMVAVLPSGMVGPNTHGKLSDTMQGLAQVLDNAFPVDPNFHIHITDVRDVAHAVAEAAERGGTGERYLLGNEMPTSTGQWFEIARQVAPHVKKPRRVSRRTMLAMACMSKMAARVTRTQPKVLKSHILLYYAKSVRLDASKARHDLGFAPRPSHEALRGAFEHLMHESRGRAA